MVGNRTRESIARTMLVIFCTGIVSAVLHLAMTTHVFLPDGSIAELDPNTGVPVPENTNGNPLEEGCPFLSSLTSVNTIVSHDIVGLCIPVLIDRTNEECTAGEVQTKWNLYRLSPSNSPPV